MEICHIRDGNDTALTLAAHYKVGKATIERDATYARAVDTLAEAIGPEMRQALLARDAKVGRQEVRMLAEIVRTSPAVAKEIGDTVRAASPSQAVKAALAVAATPCTICHRPLTNGDSLKRGIGPICACQKPSASFAGGPGPGAAGVTQPSLEALLQEALRSVGALDEWLAGAVLPDALESHADMGVQLGQTCQRLLEQLSTAPAIVEALFGKPAPPARPTPANDVDMKPCRHGHIPYEAGRKECPACVMIRKRRQRQRGKTPKDGAMSVAAA